MKKALKIIGIVLASLIVIVLIVVGVAIWIVFTPERLTPIVQKESAKLITCESHIENVELTFFSTFPNFGLKLNDVYVVNPMSGALSDTVASLHSLTASVDLMAYLKRKEVVLHHFILEDGVVNLYTNADSVSNFDILAPSDTTTTEEEESSEPLYTKLDIKKVTLKGVRGSYIDEPMGINAQLGALNGDVFASQDGDNAEGDIKMNLAQVTATLADSIPLYVNLANATLDVNAKMDAKEGKANMRFWVDSLDFKMGNESYVDHQRIELTIPATYLIDTKKLTLHHAVLDYGDLKLDVNGWAQLMGDSIDTDLEIKSNTWNIPYVLSLVPETFKSAIADMKIEGDAEAMAIVKGIYYDQSLPDILATVELKNGSVKSAAIPVVLKKIDTKIIADLKLDSGEISNATIEHLNAQFDNSKVEASGTVKDLLNSQLCNLNVSGNIDLIDVAPFLPEDLGMRITGMTKAGLKAQFKLDDLTNMRLERIKLNGQFVVDKLNVTSDSLKLSSPQMDLAITIPSKTGQKRFKELIEADIKSPKIEAEMVGTGHALITDLDLDAIVSDPFSTTQPLKAIAMVKLNELKGAMDTMDIMATKVEAQIDYFPQGINSTITDISLNYFSKSLKGNMGHYASVSTDDLGMLAEINYNSADTTGILSWDPRLTVDLQNGSLQASEISVPISIPRVNFDFSPGNCIINDGRFIIGNSDFNLHGELTNLDEFVNQTGLLVGNLDFDSRSTDVNQLMELVNGMGRTDSVVPMESPEDDPFMVPKGIDITLNTNIKEAYAGNGVFDDVSGKVTVKDGILILEQMGFTSKAAEMQLTAMYRSDRKNHLFAGIDFHLLNIDVRELIHLVPDIDTIVPMLKSFDGKAEFHLAAETYLKSNYDLKMSTLRGAAAIEGKDLVVLDNETFSTISKYMMFNKKTRNQIDTMSVEMTVFRNAVDVYPFLIVMDKYRAIISGRHNLDMTFDYNLSAIAPIRLGLDVTGNLDNMKFKLTKAQNATLFNPEKRKVVEAQTMELKNMINESLKKSVKKRDE